MGRILVTINDNYQLYGSSFTLSPLENNSHYKLYYTVILLFWKREQERFRSFGTF